MQEFNLTKADCCESCVKIKYTHTCESIDVYAELRSASLVQFLHESVSYYLNTNTKMQR